MPALDLSDPADRVLPRVLARQAEALGDLPYLRAGDHAVSYGETFEHARRHAGGLADLGVGAGDTVALLMRTSPDVVWTTFGVNALGAVWIPTNVDYKGAWLRQSLEDSRAKVLVADGDLLERVVEAGGDLPFEHVVAVGDPAAEVPGALTHPMAEIAEGRPVDPQPETRWSDTAAVLWTSGTTGRSKGVMQSHNAWLRGAESGRDTSGTTDDDVLYCCLPMYNSAAWVAVVYRALVSGISFGLDPQFSVNDFWDRTRHYGATQTFTMGAMHIFLWQRPEAPDDADNPVRLASCIPMPEPLIEPFKARFGIDSIYQGYGQSEIMGLVSRVDDGSVDWEANAAGTPLPGLDVRLLDDDDREVPVGEVGEFCVRPDTPHTLMNGYFNDPEATVKAVRNLWYHTGDLGRRNEQGQFFFFDRKADYIRHKGRSVSSFAIEAAVSGHPGVAEAAAFGVTSEHLDSEAEIAVKVVRRPGEDVTAEDIARFVNDNAPYFFVPRYVDFVEELPHTPTGRVQKYRLREEGLSPEAWDREATGFEVVR